MRINFGPVFITKGKHQGRIGNYDDTDTLFSNEEGIDREFLEVNKWRDYEDEDTGEIIQALEMAIVYTGDFLLADGYYVVPQDYIRSVTTYDLLSRREKLHKFCSWLERTEYSEPEFEPEEELEYMRELHYIESNLVDRMIEARYLKAGQGMKVFISHSSEDKSVARAIATDLAASGHNPWLDEWEIKIGESIPRKISQGVAEANFLIVILSEHSVKSNWVETEWQNKYWDEVNSGNVHVLPILHQECDIPELLKTKKYADCSKNYNEGLNDILLAINHLSHSDK